jgi:hypothetical protein
MARRLLSPGELADLDHALIEAYRAHRALRDRFPIARFISRPGIPAPLSESLVAHAAPTLFGASATVAYGGGRADLRVAHISATPIFIEVKATGSGEFQEIKPRDLAADVLIWVAFGDRYEVGAGDVHLYLLPRPERFVPPSDGGGQPRRKFMLQTFLAQASELDGFSHWVAPGIPGTPAWVSGSKNSRGSAR